MLDDLQQLVQQPWRKRAQVYLVTAGVITVGMVVTGFDPMESGAPVWLAAAAGVLGLVSRVILPVVLPITKLRLNDQAEHLRHEQDLNLRNLRAPRERLEGNY
jgi:hypothetical protein